MDISYDTIQLQRRRFSWGPMALYIILGLGGVTMVLPFLWTLLTALKTFSEIMTNPYGLPRQWVWSNFIEVFRVVPFLLYFANTLKITAVCTIGTVATSAIAAYAFARLRFPGREVIFMCYLGTLMIPRQITLVPTFLLMKWLGLLDNHLSLILPGLFSAYGTFLLRQFFLTIPYELEEAAIVDGCGYVRRFVKIILPLAKPALATLGVIALIGNWNDFLHPLIFLNSEAKRTLTLGLAIFRGDVDIQWNLLMAATLLAILPMVAAFLLAQRFFVEGIALSGIKG